MAVWLWRWWCGCVGGDRGLWWDDYKMVFTVVIFGGRQISWVDGAKENILTFFEKVKIFFFDWHYSRVQWKVFSVLFPTKKWRKIFSMPPSSSFSWRKKNWSYLTKTFGIKRRLPHNSVCSLLPRQVAISITAFNFNCGWFNPSFLSWWTFNHLCLVSLFLSPSHIHPEKHVSPVLHWKWWENFTQEKQ